MTAFLLWFILFGLPYAFAVTVKVEEMNPKPNEDKLGPLALHIGDFDANIKRKDLINGELIFIQHDRTNLLYFNWERINDILGLNDKTRKWEHNWFFDSVSKEGNIRFASLRSTVDKPITFRMTMHDFKKILNNGCVGIEETRFHAQDNNAEEAFGQATKTHYIQRSAIETNDEQREDIELKHIKVYDRRYPHRLKSQGLSFKFWDGHVQKQFAMSAGAKGKGHIYIKVDGQWRPFRLIEIYFKRGQRGRESGRGEDFHFVPKSEDVKIYIFDTVDDKPTKEIAWTEKEIISNARAGNIAMYDKKERDLELIQGDLIKSEKNPGKKVKFGLEDIEAKDNGEHVPPDLDKKGKDTEKSKKPSSVLKKSRYLAKDGMIDDYYYYYYDDEYSAKNKRLDRLMKLAQKLGVFDN